MATLASFKTKAVFELALGPKRNIQGSRPSSATWLLCDPEQVLTSISFLNSKKRILRFMGLDEDEMIK